ncbi:putative plant self-incompatibility S1 [Lupinus albus]|uniref:S-protein homolog n=1 Tax=Lupinus albus TaxID=3870 RepID=A0A6A4QHN5_LUPAL|nr:putative plant self-incompatibility S1 [Lupinus albus]
MDAILGNKNMVLLMSLTIFVTLQMMVGVVSGGFFENTKITLTNKLPQPVSMHCKDAITDDGPQILVPGEGHRFKFFKAPFIKYIWSCTFQWNGKVHEYDIYDSRRDNCFEYDCYWLIAENGPCQIVHSLNDSPVCFSWN